MEPPTMAATPTGASEAVAAPPVLASPTSSVNGRSD